ncbi:hypothetical protein MBLNU457_1426t1 [Dothideomycetes sp. NU457]
MSFEDFREAIAKHLDGFLSKREPPKTFCPSEVARSLSSAELKSVGYDDWRSAMDDIRQLAQEQRSRNELEVLQKGEVIEPGILIRDIKGPIRLRRATNSNS